MSALAVDGAFWGGEERGVAVATRRLVNAVFEAPRSFEIRAFAGHDAVLPQGLPRERVRRVFGASRVLWQQLRLPPRLRSGELLYAPAYTAPLTTRAATIVTVHDLIAWTHPALCRWQNVLHFRALMGHSVARARAVTVPTEAVASDLVRILGVPEARVHVVPWGVDGELPDHPPVRPGPYLLFVGCWEPKKTPGLLLRLADASPVPILAVGPHGGRAPPHPRLTHLGYVTPARLASLYAGASLLVFPSRAEGFGLPVAEAMRFGCPVLSTDIPAIREVAGDAACLVPAGDAEALLDAAAQLLADDALRAELTRRGRQRVERFKWAAAARAFIRVVEGL